MDMGISHYAFPKWTSGEKHVYGPTPVQVKSTVTYPSYQVYCSSIEMKPPSAYPALVYLHTYMYMVFVIHLAGLNTDKRNHRPKIIHILLVKTTW